MTKRRSAPSAGPGATPARPDSPPAPARSALGSTSRPSAPQPDAAAKPWFALDSASRSSIPLFDVAAIRRLEAAAQAALPPFALMSRAGAAAARWLSAHAPAGLLLFLAGPGNNGGDALVAATRLHGEGRTVRVWLLADPARLPPDAARAWREAGAAGVPMQPMLERFSGEVATDVAPGLPDATAAMVDGLLGIGLNRPAHGAIAAAIAFMNTHAGAGLPVFALDAPSGLSTDTGAGQPAVQACRTLTFIAAKPGLLTLSGRDHAGSVDIAPIGLAYPPQEPATAYVNVPASFIDALPARQHASHKGSFGSLAIVGGSPGMVGAPLLGARAALYLGAGRVHVGFLARNPPLADLQHPELMLHDVADIPWHALSALVIGPGLGVGADSARRLAEAIDACANGNPPVPIVLDADALNLLAADASLGRKLLASPSPRVLTPHPLEAARLAGCDVGEIQQDRIGAARNLSAAWNATAVLKGSGTVVAACAAPADMPARDGNPGGTPSDERGDIHDAHRARRGEHRPEAAPTGAAIAVNPTGNAALATAGTGDVLAGIIGALLAQGMDTGSAARAGVWIHGHAADDLVAQGVGPAGLTASELAAPARACLNALMRATATGKRS